MIPAGLRDLARPAGKSLPIPAPLGGLNARDPWREMPKGDAIVLRNWVVRDYGLEQRKGYTVRNTGLTGGVTALMRAGDRYFAATQTAIWEITASGAAVSAVTGFTGGRWSWAPFANGAGAGIIATNGSGPRYFINGTWGSSAITGVRKEDLISVCVHGRRAVFIENGALQLWYLPINAFQGTARLLDVKPLVKRGGELLACASHSDDGATNGASKLYTITSNGELIVYAGYDPDNAATWSLVGVYDVPPPVGRDCFCRVGQQLAYLSRDGLLSIPALLGKSRSEEQDAALTAKIARAYDEAIADAEDDGNPYPYTFDATTAWLFDDTDTVTFDMDLDASPGTEETWNVCEAGSENVLIINRTRTGGNRQFVLGDKGWSEWSGLAATCWIDTGKELWFGTAAGTVCRYTGTTDNGASIDSYMVEAYARASGRVERQTVIMPLFEDPPTYRPRIKMIYDFADPAATFTATTQAFQKGAAQVVAGRGRDSAFCMSVKSSRGCLYIGRDSIVEAGGNP